VSGEHFWCRRVRDQIVTNARVPKKHSCNSGPRCRRHSHKINAWTNSGGWTASSKGTAAVLWLLRYCRESGSVVDSCVLFDRFWPCHRLQRCGPDQPATRRSPDS